MNSYFVIILLVNYAEYTFHKLKQGLIDGSVRFIYEDKRIMDTDTPAEVKCLIFYPIIILFFNKIVGIMIFKRN